ncbi:unnamed protein product [marine sediment metagenome]|uniref:Outer membrane lipoprotein BamD-like domain-containing protein n=1 Tax=marine sediment metagenome TaxID=412755 RepID=X0YL69_9ZZZZ
MKSIDLKGIQNRKSYLIRYFYKIQEDLKDVKVPYHIMVKCADILFKYRQYNMAEDLYKKVIKTFPEAPDIAAIYYKRARLFFYYFRKL